MGWVGGGTETSNQMLQVVGVALKIEVIKIEVIQNWFAALY